ncbi:MAG TPA: GntR family transcriptional regulator [Oscillospiraceae bacterium]|nr:GntR family transcriptional regulator [Oscillospiraceae bacterium]
MENLKAISSDHTSLTTEVFRELEKAILDGRFSAGDSLTELKISKQLGVSRTPVREALRQLELEGFVKYVPNKGAIVIGISKKDIQDIYEIRMVLEALAVRWAAENITDEELDQLKDVVELQEFYAKKGDTIQVWQLDSKFHDIIFTSSRSKPLMNTLSNFHHYIQKARELSIKAMGRAESVSGEHRKIYEALKNHDAENAAELAKAHVLAAMENFLNSYK